MLDLESVQWTLLTCSFCSSFCSPSQRVHQWLTVTGSHSLLWLQVLTLFKHSTTHCLKLKAVAVRVVALVGVAVRVVARVDVVVTAPITMAVAASVAMAVVVTTLTSLCQLCTNWSHLRKGSPN